MEEGQPSVHHVETLTGHTKAVNSVRFAPGGNIIASAGDGGDIMLWKPRSDDGAVEWRMHCSLKGHGEDVQDLAWSSDGAGSKIFISFVLI
jgi:chromatin assembly factor 1 subunit B